MYTEVLQNNSNYLGAQFLFKKTKTKLLSSQFLYRKTQQYYRCKDFVQNNSTACIDVCGTVQYRKYTRYIVFSLNNV